MTEKNQTPKSTESSLMTRLSKNSALMVLLFLVLLMSTQLFNSQENGIAEFTYTEFRDQLARDNIVGVVVIESRRIEGELRVPYVSNGEDFQEFTTMLPGEMNAQLLDELEQQNVEISGRLETQGWGSILLGMLPWLLFLGFWIWIFRTMQAGGNKAFQFGRSKAKLISPDTPKVTFDDVAGAEEAKTELQEIIEFLRDPEKFARLGGRLPKGVLLVGPPGTGKNVVSPCRCW